MKLHNILGATLALMFPAMLYAQTPVNQLPQGKEVPHVYVPGNKVSLAATGGPAHFTVLADVDYMANAEWETGEEPWFTLSRRADGTWKIVSTPWDGKTVRRGNIVFSYGDQQKVVPVVQQPAVEGTNQVPTYMMSEAYQNMVRMQGNNHDSFGYMAVLHVANLMSEDMVMAGETHFFYDYTMGFRMANYRRPQTTWWECYDMVTYANSVITLYSDGGSTPAEKALVGQAYAMRALGYFQAIQIFQNVVDAEGNLRMDAPGVPLYFTDVEGKSKAEIEAALGRNTVKQVFEQIENDLLTALDLLMGYQRASKNEIDAQVTLGLLARYYLLTQQWTKAVRFAIKAADGYPLMGADKNGLYDGFLNINNPEWMWGFDHTPETGTYYASFFSMISNVSEGYAGLFCPMCIDRKLYESIPETDARKAWFNDEKGNPAQATAGAQHPYANLKFGRSEDFTADYIYMRASEMVLIEAEAYARMGNGAWAAEALGKLMKLRDPKWNKTEVTAEEVYQQRRIELWGEGFSFFDLKRLNKGIDRNYEGTNHSAPIVVPAQDVKWTYQLPNLVIESNPHISEEDQNP